MVSKKQIQKCSVIVLFVLGGTVLYMTFHQLVCKKAPCDAGYCVKFLFMCSSSMDSLLGNAKYRVEEEILSFPSW